MTYTLFRRLRNEGTYSLVEAGRSDELTQEAAAQDYLARNRTETEVYVVSSAAMQVFRSTVSAVRVPEEGHVP